MAAHRPSAARDFVITCIKGEGPLLKFWAIPVSVLETVKKFENHFSQISNDLEARKGFSTCEQIKSGLKCVVKSKIHKMWCRARVLQYQDYTSVIVQLLDYGNEEVIQVADIRTIDEQILSIPAQAVECILADVVPIHPTEWSAEAIEFCGKHLLFNTLSCFVVSDYMKIPIVRVAKKGESEAFVQRLINGGLALIKQERVSPPPPSLSYKMNNMDPNSSHLVRVACIENPYKFYVQLSAAEVELKNLMDSINRIPKETLTSLKVPAINTPCLAQLSASSNPCYYRALLTFVQQTRCKVFFVDYGFTELKEIHELRAIPPAFLSLAAQAICCSLPRDVSINPEELKRFIGLEHLELQVVNRSPEAYIVRLFYHGRDLSMTPPAPQNYVQQKLQPLSKFEVTVSYVNSFTEFYCQLNNLKDQVNEISHVLNSGYNFIPISLIECTPGKPVCVKFSEDNLWYRARVVKVNHESDIEVFFVDYGNFDNVNLSDVRRIGPDLLKYPIQAFKCYLFDVNLPSDSKVHDEAFDLLEESSVDQNLFAQFNVFTGDSGYGITLYSKTSPTSINEKMQALFSLSIPTIPVDDLENLYITSFESPSSFFAQFEKLDDEKLGKLQEEINLLYSGQQNISYKPKEGKLVCARSTIDDQFYRARVENCNDGFCNVYFIDYGNRESIPIKDVHSMDVRFSKCPQFGVECALLSCPPHCSGDKLSSVMLEKSIQAKMIRKENEKWYISLNENYAGNAAILEVLKPAPRSILGTGLGGYQEKSFNNAVTHQTMTNSDNKTSHVNANNNNSVKSYNNEEYSLKSIPSKAYRNVYVSHVISPSQFYCQVEEDNSKLQLLTKTIEEVYSLDNEELNLSKFVMDTPCCAMFEDGSWYRGTIKKVDPQFCDVFFVDYGNTDSVSKSKIKKLKNDLFCWPAQALCCKSFNVSPKGNNWSDSEIDAFTDKTLDKSFVAQFVECDKNNVYSVTLVSLGKLQEDTVNKEFVSMGFGRLQDSNKSIVLNSRAASTNLTFSAINVQLGASEAVQVTYGLNPGEIFCQLKSSTENFKQMMIELQSYYNKVSEAECLIDRPHPGMICAAQFYLDSAWYRAEIRKVETNKISVFYVDYGNLEIVDRKKIRCIIQEYTTLPMQAIKCRIKGIKPPGKSWTVNANLSKYFEGNTVCKFISKENDYFLVEITCNQKDVAQLLIADKFAESDSPVVQSKSSFARDNVEQSKSSFARDNVEQPKINKVVVPETTAPPKPMQLIPARKDNFVQGQLISVTVSYVENPSKFWCQLLDESYILDQIMEDIETQISECPAINSASLKVGCYILAQYSEDEAWYRAQIKSCDPGNVYKVFFIDYGNADTVSGSEIKSMLPKMMEQPPQCFECSLLNTPSKLLPEMTTLFQDTIQEEGIEVTAKIENVKSGICTVTLLFDKEDQEINVNELLFGVTEQSSESSIQRATPQFLTPDVPLGLHDGYVSSVNTPQDFYIQLAGTEDALADLSAELADLSESAFSIDLADLCVGYACASKYSEDNNWYRAEIIAMKDSTVDVLFVDYGNVDTIEKDTLKSLSEKHLQMKPLAIKCKMNGIVPAGDEWSSEAINTFQDMVLEECLGITFISKDIPATVNITKNDKEISQCLVDAELANVETSAETDEAYAEDHLAPAPTEDPLSSLPSDQAYPERKLHSTKHIVKICYVDSYDKFSVTPSELRTELDTVMTTLEILYTDNAEATEPKSNVPEILEDPKVSMPCVAKYSEDEAWYRALITEIEGENIYISFVDYGNSEVTTISNLRPLTPELVKIPPIALECSLYGIEAIEGQEQAITAKLEEYYVEEVELEMEICEFAPYKIRLYNNGEDIGLMFVKDGLAKELPILSDENEIFNESSKMTFVDGSLEYRIQISKRFFSDADKIIGNVKFCEVENDFIVFHVVSTDLEDDLQALQQKLQDAYVEPPKNLTNVACMDFCATKYVEDENWYRAQVLSCDKDKVKVRFIDYGNCETVDKTDIFELLSDFTVEPQFSVKCVLFGLKVNKSKEVELQNRLDECVYHEPVELNLCKHSHALYDLCITSLVCGEADISATLTNELLVSQQYVNSPLEDSFKATVQKVTSDVVFLLPLKTIDEREAFQCKLQGVCNDLDASSDVLTHYLYGAKVEDIWYRVAVINISDNEVTVDLVDFGSTKVVKKTEFVLLPVDICHQPVFLQQCIVKTVEDQTGNAKSIHTQELSVGKVVACEIQKSYPIVHPFVVRLLEIESEEKVEESVEHNALNENSTDDEKNVESDVQEKISVDQQSTDEGKDNQEENDETIVREVEEIVDVEHNIENSEEIVKTDNENIDNEIDKNNDKVMNDDESIENYFEEIVETDDKANMGDNENIEKCEETMNDIKETVDDEEIIEKNELLNDQDSESVENYSEEIVKTDDKQIMDDNENIQKGDEITNDDQDKESVENYFEEIVNTDDKENMENIEECDELLNDGNDTQSVENYNENILLSDDKQNIDEIINDNNNMEEVMNDDKENMEIMNDDNKENMEENDMQDENKENIEFISSEANVSTIQDEYNLDNMEVSGFVEPQFDDAEGKEQKFRLLEEYNANESTSNVAFEEDVYEKKFEGEKKENIDTLESEKLDELLDNEPFEDTECNDKLKNSDENELISSVSNEKAQDAKQNYETGEINTTDMKEELKSEILNQYNDSTNSVYNENEDKISTECNSVESENKIDTLSSYTSQTKEQNMGNETNCTDDEKNNSTCDLDADQDSLNVLANEVQDDAISDESIQGNTNMIESSSNMIDSCVESESKIEEDSVCIVNSSGDMDIENNRSIEDSCQLSGSVPVKVSDIAISDGSVIFAVLPVYLEEEFLLLKQSMHDFYSSEAIPYDINSEINYCAVFYENEWCRGKILEKADDSFTVMLIDYGKCVSVDNSIVKNLSSEHCNVPPFAVWCTLSSVVCSFEKSETAKTYLNDKLKNVIATVKILEGYEPYKINIFVDGSSVLNELLNNKLVAQKLPNMYLESGSYKAKLSFLNLNSETVQIFVNLSSFSEDYSSLHESMQSTYKVEDFVANVTESGIYAAFYNDSWYRGSVVSVGNEMQVYLVDTGETIALCKLCFLLPEHCLQPAYAIPCRISCSDIEATNEIYESLSNVLKATEFLVNIDTCFDSNSVSATLIDEHIVSEVKNMRLSQPSSDSDSCGAKSKESLENEVNSCDTKKSTDAPPKSTVREQEQGTNEQIVGYLEESFTTEVP